MVHSDNKLNAPDESQRLYAVQDVEGPDAPKRLLDRLVIEESTAVRAAISFKLKTIPCYELYEDIFQLFRSTDAYLRNAAVGIFAAGNAEAVLFLTAQYPSQNTDREMRKLILDALFDIGTPLAIEGLREGVKDPAINVRITAVEYLGQLRDREITSTLVDLLDREDEPMLTVSILEALANIQDEPAMAQALSVLAPDGDFSAVNPFLLPEVVEFVSAAGPIEAIPKALQAIPDWNVYGDNIMRALGQAGRRGVEFVSAPEILEQVIMLARNRNVPTETRYAAVQHLRLHGNTFFSVDRMHELGLELVDEDAMAPVGVELLFQDGSEDSRARIANLMETTQDENLLELCRHLSAEEDMD